MGLTQKAAAWQADVQLGEDHQLLRWPGPESVPCTTGEAVSLDGDAGVLLVRSAMLRGLKAEVTALGLDIFALAAAAGLDPAALTTADLRIPAHGLSKLYEMVAVRSGADDVALRVAAGWRLSNFGLVGILAREAPTLDQVLRTLQRYMWVQSEALDLVFEDIGGDVLLRLAPNLPVGKQAIDLHLGMLLVAIRYVMGKSWAPLDIFVQHPAPSRCAAYQEVLGRVPHFGQDMAGFLIAAQDLGTRNANADPDFVTQLRRQLEQDTRSRKTGFVAGVCRLIEMQLPKGDCEVDRIAAALGMSRRSFQRQLATNGTSFTTLVDAARRSAVTSLLLDPERSVERVADLLGFAGSSSFDQWFKSRFGCTPSIYRQQAR